MKTGGCIMIGQVSATLTAEDTLSKIVLYNIRH